MDRYSNTLYRLPHIDEMRLAQIRKEFAAGGLVSEADIERYGSVVSTGEVFEWRKALRQRAERERTAFDDFAAMLMVHGREARMDKPKKVRK